MSRTTSPLCALLFALAAGCGGGSSSSYHIPTGEQVKPFQAPEKEALLSDEDDAWDLEAEDLDEEDAEEPAAAPQAAPAGNEAAMPAAKAEDAAKQPAKPAKTPAN